MPMRTTPVILTLICISATAVRAEHVAIVVGVNDCPAFRLADGSKPRGLKGAEADADAVAGLLRESYGFANEQIILLKGREASRAAIHAAFEQASKRVGTNDVFIFHFSGHGTQLADQKPFDEKDELDEALCPHDVGGGGENLIVDDELGRWLNGIRGRTVTVILDCCHAESGTKDPDAELTPRFLRSTAKPAASAADSLWAELRDTRKGLGPARTAFFACRAEQQAYERPMRDRDPPTVSGQFTRYFLEGIAKERTNAAVLRHVQSRLDQSFNHARPHVKLKQEPMMEGDQGESLIFGLNRKKSP